MHQLGILTFADFRGGRNGVDFPLSLQETQVCEAINVDWYTGMLARRRLGAIRINGGNNPPVGSTVRSLARFLPGNLENVSELFVFGMNGTCARSRFGVWSNVTVADPSTYRGVVDTVTFNYKLFAAYKCPSDTLHVFDPTLDAFRVVGLGGATGPAAPVITPGAAGSITGTRYYKVAWTRQASGVTVARSLTGAVSSLAITNLASWNLARPALQGIETHWETYAAAAAGGPWYLVQTLPIGTLAWADTTPVASFPPLGAPLEPTAGSQTPAPNGKFLLIDGSRILIASSYVNKQYESRVWWTAVLNDASGVNNDERINMSLAPYIDFDAGEGGGITGIGGPIFDSPYVFKMNRIYKMVRTGNSQAPYRPVTLTKNAGAIHQRTIVVGEDANGNECLYFLSRRGPCRIGSEGLEYLGRDVEDLWRKVNLDAAAMSGVEDPTPPGVGAGAHGIYHQDLHQVWWYVPTSDYGTPPETKLVFDTRLGIGKDVHGVRGGWSQHNGLSCNAVCSRMFSDRTQPTASATLDPLVLKPHIGANFGSTPTVYMADATDVTTDDSFTYDAQILTRAVLLSQSLVVHGGVLEGHLVLSNNFDHEGDPTPNHAGLDMTAIADFGMEWRYAQLWPIRGPVEAVQYDALGTSQPMPIIVPIRNLGAASAACVQIWIKDVRPEAVVSVNWILNQLILRVRREEDR